MIALDQRSHRFRAENLSGRDQEQIDRDRILYCPHLHFRFERETGWPNLPEVSRRDLKAHSSPTFSERYLSATLGVVVGLPTLFAPIDWYRYGLFDRSHRSLGHVLTCNIFNTRFRRFKSV